MNEISLIHLLCLATLALYVIAFFIGFRRPNFYKQLTEIKLMVVCFIASGAVYAMAFYDFSIPVMALIMVIQISSSGLLCVCAGSATKAYILKKAAALRIRNEL